MANLIMVSPTYKYWYAYVLKWNTVFYFSYRAKLKGWYVSLDDCIGNILLYSPIGILDDTKPSG